MVVRVGVGILSTTIIISKYRNSSKSTLLFQIVLYQLTYEYVMMIVIACDPWYADKSAIFRRVA